MGQENNVCIDTLDYCSLNYIRIDTSRKGCTHNMKNTYIYGLNLENHFFKYKLIKTFMNIYLIVFECEISLQVLIN